VLEKPIVDIGGIAVDQRSAMEWEKNGRLPFGTVSRAPVVDMHATLPAPPAAATAGGRPTSVQRALASEPETGTAAKGAAAGEEEAHVAPAVALPPSRGFKARLGGMAWGATKTLLGLAVQFFLGWVAGKAQEHIDTAAMKRDWEKKIVPPMEKDLDQALKAAGGLQARVDAAMKEDPLGTLYIHLNYRYTTMALFDPDPEVGGEAPSYYGMEYVGISLGTDQVESETLEDHDHGIGWKSDVHAVVTSIPVVEMGAQVTAEAAAIGTGLALLQPKVKSLMGADDADLAAAARELFSFSLTARVTGKKAAGTQVRTALDKVSLFRRNIAFRAAGGSFGSPEWKLSNEAADLAQRLSDLAALFP
jgi:hypothetical protein